MKRTLKRELKKYLKLLTGKGSQPVISKLHSLFLREELLEAKKSQHHLGIWQKTCELVRCFGFV